MTNWRAIWAVFAGGVVAGAYMTKVAPALPGLREELGLTLVESGLIATTFNLMGMLVGTLAGVLCDRFGHKRLAVSGLLILALGGGLGAFAGGFGSLLVARFLEGVGFIAFVVSALALVNAAAATPRDRAKALGLWSAYMPTGGTIALLAAPWLIAASGWRGLWMALSLAAVVAAIALARVVPVSRYGEVGSMRLVTESLARGGNIAMAALFAFYVAQWTSIMVWLPTFLIDEHRLSDASAALATALFVLINAPGNLTGGWLLARGLRRGTLIVTGAAIAALCEIGMFAEALPPALRYLLVLAFSFSAGVIPAAVFSGLPVHARTPQHIGTGNGIVMQASQVGQFLGPLALAWIATRFGGWEASLWALLAFAAGAVLCGVAIGAIEHRIK
ncbi:MAG TPA: MFS transporter [Burkholderiales bacterium]|nr:MFS transporter [Burkholderiales bacterium]